LQADANTASENGTIFKLGKSMFTVQFNFTHLKLQQNHLLI